MGRRVWSLLSVLSLLLGAGFAALWVRSYFVHDIVQVTGGIHHLVMHSEAGGVAAIDIVSPSELPREVQWIRGPASDSESEVGGLRLPNPTPDFFYSSDFGGWPRFRWHVQFPLWAGVVAGAFLPGIRLLARRCRLRRSPRAFPIQPAPDTPRP